MAWTGRAASLKERAGSASGLCELARAYKKRCVLPREEGEGGHVKSWLVRRPSATLQQALQNDAKAGAMPPRSHAYGALHRAPSCAVVPSQAHHCSMACTMPPPSHTELSLEAPSGAGLAAKSAARARPDPIKAECARRPRQPPTSGKCIVHAPNPTANTSCWPAWTRPTHCTTSSCPLHLLCPCMQASRAAGFSPCALRPLPRPPATP